MALFFGGLAGESLLAGAGEAALAGGVLEGGLGGALAAGGGGFLGAEALGGLGTAGEVAGGIGAATGGGGGFSDFLGGLGSVGNFLKTNSSSILGGLNMAGGLYGLMQARQLRKMGQPKGITDSGLQAVQRSMAAQGYQGSGNMAAELMRYGMDSAQPNVGAAAMGLSGEMSSLGLMTSGLPKLLGWPEPTPAKKPGG